MKEKSTCFWKYEFWTHQFTYIFQSMIFLEADWSRIYAVLYLKSQKLGVCPLHSRLWIRLSEHRKERVSVLKALVRKASQWWQSRGEIWHCHLLFGDGYNAPPSFPTVSCNCPALVETPHSFLTQLGLGFSADLLPAMLLTLQLAEDNRTIIWMFDKVKPLILFWFSFRIEAWGEEKRENRVFKNLKVPFHKFQWEVSDADLFADESV